MGHSIMESSWLCQQRIGLKRRGEMVEAIRAKPLIPPLTECWRAARLQVSIAVAASTFHGHDMPIGFVVGYHGGKSAVSGLGRTAQ